MFSPDNKFFALGSFREAQLFNAQNGQPMSQPIRHENAVILIAISPDSSRICTASDVSACISDARTGSLICLPLKHNEPVTETVISPNIQFVATVSLDRTIRIWDAYNGTVVRNQGKCLAQKYDTRREGR